MALVDPQRTLPATDPFILEMQYDAEMCTVDIGYLGVHNETANITIGFSIGCWQNAG
jgi:hypothetical protein